MTNLAHMTRRVRVCDADEAGLADAAEDCPVENMAAQLRSMAARMRRASRSVSYKAKEAQR